MLRTRKFAALLLVSWLAAPRASWGDEAGGGRPGLILSEFLYESGPIPSCHASTIVEAGGGLVAAWFGGTDEGDPDVGIWLGRNDGKGWSSPVEVARGEQGGVRLPCWNPVLFQAEGGPLMLFYKVGPEPSRWWGMLTTSDDRGKTWSAALKLPEGILGPIKNKPIGRPGGAILCASSSEDQGWKVHFERTTDLGRTWVRTGPVEGKAFEAIQPSILTHAGGRLQALCRTRQGRIVETWSADGGATWSGLAATSLPNPNSGTDAVTLADGRQLLVYNHAERGRSPLNVAIAADGKAWRAALVLEDEPGEFSYPAVIQSADGLVHVTYTWNRKKIKHAILDPAKLILRDLGAIPPSAEPSIPAPKPR